MPAYFNPGVSHNPFIAKLAGIDVMTFIGNHGMMTLGLTIAAIVLMTVICMIYGDYRKEGFGELKSEAAAELPERANVLYAVAPLVPVVLLVCTSLWLPPELMEDVCATGSPAEAFARLRNDDLRLSLEERARLLYVAMTRARELVILAMDAGVSRGKVTAPTFDVETDLTYDVLRRILPTDALDMPQLDADRLVFDNSQPGDYELISLAGFTFGEQAFEANASLDAEGRLVRGDADADAADDSASTIVPGPADPKPDSFELVYPQAVGVRMGTCPFPARDSYSYSSIAAALHAETEDRAAEARVPMDESGDDAESDGSEITDADVAAVEPAGNPMALGSAFHAACQWLIEMGADALPAARADALARRASDAARKRG